MESKAVLRKTLQQQINALPPEERSRQSQVLCDHVREDPGIEAAQCIGVYLALPDEPDLLPALEHLQRSGKQLFLPVPSPKGLWRFHELTSLRGPKQGPWGLELPPVCEQAAENKKLEVVLVPGRGFTRDGHRIGRGKGIYDRLLEGMSARTIGIGFDCQLVESLPQEPTDIVLQEVWTA